MSDYIPTAQWLASRPVPDNGNPPTAETFNQSFRDIYDRLQWLAEGNVELELLTKVFNAGSNAKNPAHWEWNSTLCAMEQIDAPDLSPAISPQRFYHLPIRVPHGSRIVAIELSVKGTAHSGLPENMPQLNLQSMSSLAVVSNHGGQTDTSANLTAYGQRHSIIRTWSAPDVLVDRSTDDYAIKIRGESGANSLTGLLVYGAAVTVAVSKVDRAAG